MLKALHENKKEISKDRDLVLKFENMNWKGKSDKIRWIS
jgi:hypothetical protein